MDDAIRRAELAKPRGTLHFGGHQFTAERANDRTARIDGNPGFGCIRVASPIGHGR
jgi:hypothetical protein